MENPQEYDIAEIDNVLAIAKERMSEIKSLMEHASDTLADIESNFNAAKDSGDSMEAVAEELETVMVFVRPYILLHKACIDAVTKNSEYFARMSDAIEEIALDWFTRDEEFE